MRKARGTSPSSRSGVALLLTLILVSALALIVIFLLSLSRNEVEITRPISASVRAKLAEEAAFATALARLSPLVANDDYFVTMVRGGTGASGKDRYTFLTTPSHETLTHTPLFAGGNTQTSAMPNFDAIETSALADQSLAAPVVEFLGSTRRDLIELPPLSELDAQGSVITELSTPELGIEELSPPSDSHSPWGARFTYWIEDLEGYPNRDAVSITANEASTAAIMTGYRARDSRVGNPKAFPLSSTSGTLYRFPSVLRGQSFTNQIVPGLSTREIVLQSWPLLGNEKGKHPFDFASSSPDANRSRFAYGLSPYRAIPMIPYGHGYVDEGKSRYNLNTLVAERDLKIADLVSRNLPRYEDRKGGFPPDESYLGTLAANVIDYVDEDGKPSLPSNTKNAKDRKFRGVDAYCPVNEFFVRFRYIGYKVQDKSDLIIFEATPYAEFWNPFDQGVAMSNVRLRFRFLDSLKFQANSKWYEIPDSTRVSDEAFPTSGGISVSVPPGHYEIVQFGAIRWEILIPRPPLVAFPVIQDLRGVTNASVRAQYELFLGDDLVDRCGRADPGDLPSKPRHGFFFARQPSVMQSGESFMRLAIPNLSAEEFGAAPTPVGSHLGDPWMPWFSRTTAENSLYRLRASPGYRNFDSDKVTSSRPDLLKDQVRVRDWPDRGYDSSHPRQSPKSDEETPELFRRPVNPEEAAFAPWRLSQLGRFFSVTELGHIHDPVMWIPKPENIESDFSVTQPLTHHYDTLRETSLKSLPITAQPGKSWGGGNTLRIGRPEHALFDRPGMRASQWLDLFHTGYPGTNLRSAAGNDAALYLHYDPDIHRPPPTASDPVRSAMKPYSLVYDADLNAQGAYALIYGQMNLNTVPTRFEVETLLRGPSVSSDLRITKNRFDTPEYEREGSREFVRSAIREEAIPEIADGLIAARPFYSPSHLARVFSELLRRHEALPEHHNDAEAEEPFARLFHATTLSSRHFRIHTAAEVFHRTTGEVVARRHCIRDVFARPIRDSTGRIERVQMEVFSTREP